MIFILYTCEILEYCAVRHACMQFLLADVIFHCMKHNRIRAGFDSIKMSYQYKKEIITKVSTHPSDYWLLLVFRVSNTCREYNQVGLLFYIVSPKNWICLLAVT